MAKHSNILHDIRVTKCSGSFKLYYTLHYSRIMGLYLFSKDCYPHRFKCCFNWKLNKKRERICWLTLCRFHPVGRVRNRWTESELAPFPVHWSNSGNVHLLDMDWDSLAKWTFRSSRDGCQMFDRIEWLLTRNSKSIVISTNGQ